MYLNLLSPNFLALKTNIYIMKKLLLFAILFFNASWAISQLVITVAGQLEIAGSQDGANEDAIFDNPHGIAIDGQGNVYVADRFSHVIRKITPDDQVITIAGTPYVSGDQDGQGFEATFNEPWGLCADQSGNVYVADTRNNKIRKINSEGFVTTIAGSGNFGTSDGFATGATFGNPTGIEIDMDGNLYVADHLTHIIRKITPSGTVSTLAGTPYIGGAVDGPQGIGSFRRPYGLTLDLEGNIIVADEWNHLIRKVTPTGMVTTIAGTGDVGVSDGQGTTASFNYPWDVTVDSLGNIFVADGYNFIVRKIDETGYVSAFAGSPLTTGGVDGVGENARFNGATSIAISPFSGEIFVGDAYNHLVRKIIDLNQDIRLSSISNSWTLCENETLNVEAVPSVYDAYTFYLDGVELQSTSSAIIDLSGMLPGMHSLRVSCLRDGQEFESAMYPIEVVAMPDPEIILIGDPIIFEGDSVTLLTGSFENYLWSNGAITPTISVTETGSYWVEVTDQEGCIAQSEPIEIQVNEISLIPAIHVNGELPICPSASVVLQSSYMEGNQWLLNGWPITDAVDHELVVMEEGTYQVQITDSLGYTYLSAPLEVSQSENFITDFVVNKTIAFTSESLDFIAQANFASSFVWDFGDPDSGSLNEAFTKEAQHTYEVPGEYTVSLTVTFEDGCEETLVKTAYVEIVDQSLSDRAIFVPNAFTPNGDGVNDLFEIFGPVTAPFQMAVFNQWGEKIFYSTDPQNGWNGTYNGSSSPIGSYAYCIEYTSASGKQSKKGFVNLIR